MLKNKTKHTRPMSFSSLHGYVTSATHTMDPVHIPLNAPSFLCHMYELHPPPPPPQPTTSFIFFPHHTPTPPSSSSPTTHHSAILLHSKVHATFFPLVHSIHTHPIIVSQILEVKPALTFKRFRNVI